MNKFHLREKILQIHEQRDDLYEQVVDLLHKLQANCSHPSDAIMCAPYERGTLIDQQEIRLCTCCGLQEEGWNPQYLGVPYEQKDKVQKVTRDQLFAARSSILNGTRVGIDKDDKPEGNKNNERRRQCNW